MGVHFSLVLTSCATVQYQVPFLNDIRMQIVETQGFASLYPKYLRQGAKRPLAYSYAECQNETEAARTLSGEIWTNGETH